MHELEVVLEAAIVRLVQSLIFAPSDGLGELSLADTVPESDALPKES